MIQGESSRSKNTLRMISLLLALLIWVNFSGRHEEQKLTQVFAPIVLLYRNIPVNHRVQDSNYLMQVWVSGSAKELKTLDAGVIKVSLDLEDFTSNTYTLPVTSKDVEIPGQFETLTVDSVRPEMVKLTLKEFGTKTIKLIVDYAGEPAQNFSVIDWETNPTFVTYEGPVNEIAGFSHLSSQTIDISGATSSVEGQFQFDFERYIPKDTVIKDTDPAKIRFKITIEEDTKKKSFKDAYPISIESDRFQLSQSEVRLTIEGPISAVDWFDPTWIVPILENEDGGPAVDQDAPATNEGEGQGGDPQGPPPLVTENLLLLVKQQFALPLEARQDEPDWEAQIAKLDFRWNPSQVELLLQEKDPQP